MLPGPFQQSPNNPGGHNPQLVLTQKAQDNFNRPNGALGGSNNWAALTANQGGLSIASNEIELVSAGVNQTAGNYRTDAVYESDQYSQAIIGTQVPASSTWVGVSTRNQDAAGNCYLGMWWNNGGTWEVHIYREQAGAYTAIAGSNVNIPTPAGGQTLRLVSEGSQHTLYLNETPYASATDTTFIGGTPGIQIACGTTSGGGGYLDNWTGGSAATGAVGATVAQDNFNRADGGVSVGHPEWQVMAYSPSQGTTVDCTIVSQQINYSTATVHGGDVRTEPTWNSDQWSEIQQGTVAMTSSGFTFATVRNQAGGRSAYIGGLFNNGSYQIYRLDGGGIAGSDHSTRLGPIVATTGNDPAGTRYTLVAQGSRISLRVNGREVLAVTDATYAGGTPGIMFYATATGDNWSGGNA